MAGPPDILGVHVEATVPLTVPADDYNPVSFLGVQVENRSMLPYPFDASVADSPRFVGFQIEATVPLTVLAGDYRPTVFSGIQIEATVQVTTRKTKDFDGGTKTNTLSAGNKRVHPRYFV